MISVGDAGSGVDAKIRDRGFEPFFTAKEAMRKKPGPKVLLTSGYTEYTANPGTWRQPGMRFIQKPYRLEDLSAMLGDILAEGEKGAG